MRLHVGEGAIKDLFRAVDGQLLGYIHVFATAVIAPAGITFSIFVGHDRALSLQNRPTNDIFGGNQFYLVALSLQLIGQGSENLWVSVHAILGKERIFRLECHGGRV